VLHLIASLAGIAVTLGATMFGYWQARQFTQNKLRYVDAVHRGGIALLAGLGAAVVAAPIVWLLPLVGGGTAILFGAGVALGVSSGAREIRKRISAG
jgi:hypothetical protein